MRDREGGKALGGPILILTEAGDLHAYAVCEALRVKGGDVHLWHTTDFPARARESVAISKAGIEINTWDPYVGRFCARGIKAVWNRRVSTVVNEDVLHEADREFARTESTIFRLSIFDALSALGVGGSFWVNPWHASLRAERKVFQHCHAVGVGFKAPDTLYSNDPEGIRRFSDAHPDGVVYKPFRQTPWTDGDNVWGIYTSKLKELPEDEIIQNAPGIYQEFVPKAYELRVTAIGKQVFPVKIYSQESEESQVDWRRGYKNLRMEACEIDAALVDRCLVLLQRMGLVFGCFDFIVTPQGETVFLEVNQMGQFLFLEVHTGVPLLDAFSEFLLQGRVDFAWSGEDAEVSFSGKMAERCRKIAKEMSERHVVNPPKVWRE